MKRNLLLAFASAALVFGGTGCLKDKDFDDNKYGINDPDASPAGVGFTNGIKFLNNTGIVLSTTTQAIDSNTVRVSLFSGRPAATDITVQIAVDPSLVDDYNDEFGTSYLSLDASTYVIGTTVTIPAGRQSGIVNITVPDASALDPNLSYALGLKIASADQNLVIASNADAMVIAIAIRNQYDGDYISNGYVYHPTVPRPIIDLEKALTTINATTVECPLGDLGPQNYRAFFEVDPGSNMVTVTIATGAAGGVYYQFDAGLPTGGPGPLYTPQWPGSSECNNTYDPATQTFKMRYGYIGGTGYRVVEEILVRQ